MVSADNVKFLPPDVQDRTGLELNPLWMMEVLVRGGVLNAKDQVTALKTLADYTHSKAPSINHTAVATQSAEEWLKALAKEEYPEVTIEERKPLPHGTHPRHEYMRQLREQKKKAEQDGPSSSEGTEEAS